MKRSAHLEILRRLGIPEHHSFYLEDFGHMGQNDQILSLELGLKTGKVRDGDVVSFASAGIGYAWASCVIEWGPSRLFEERRSAGSTTELEEVLA
jgi:3-oxoacyl-[acyl-carrier-protein] synthase-3